MLEGEEVNKLQCNGISRALVEGGVLACIQIGSVVSDTL